MPAALRTREGCRTRMAARDDVRRKADVPAHHHRHVPLGPEDVADRRRPRTGARADLQAGAPGRREYVTNANPRMVPHRAAIFRVGPRRHLESIDPAPRLEVVHVCGGERDGLERSVARGRAPLQARVVPALRAAEEPCVGRIPRLLGLDRLVRQPLIGVRIRVAKVREEAAQLASLPPVHLPDRPVAWTRRQERAVPAVEAVKSTRSILFRKTRE